MKTFGSLHRDPSKGKIAGVCAGIAEYFGMEIWLVRILTLTGFFLLAPPFFFVGYIAAWFVLEKKPRGSSPKSRNDELASKSQHNKVHSKGWHNVSEQESDKVMVKSKVWQAGEPPKQAFIDIKQRFTKNENRLRKMETYVTSSEFQLNRELSKL
ncbi:envelope stress response membrane protein PspC [uncultured Paraglaciecola sp.]|jgi:phage shock protein C|uniref:envelope stress response membrane protein PspC n=1 Tax=uncultured Paraglaciecola sp. TaxID=1765024 RepID=UPI0025F35A92|nr:envelope stress response membrane protein PspC [uncultured Paraglaciecola sp.]